MTVSGAVSIAVSKQWKCQLSSTPKPGDFSPAAGCPSLGTGPRSLYSVSSDLLMPASVGWVHSGRRTANVFIALWVRTRGRPILAFTDTDS